MQKSNAIAESNNTPILRQKCNAMRNATPHRLEGRLGRFSYTMENVTHARDYADLEGVLGLKIYTMEKFTPPRDYADLFFYGDVTNYTL